MALNASDADAVISHMNVDHADAVRLYATVHAGRADVVDATLISIGRDAMVLRCRTAAAELELEVRLPEPVETLRDARRILIQMARSARAPS